MQDDNLQLERIRAGDNQAIGTFVAQQVSEGHWKNYFEILWALAVYHPIDNATAAIEYPSQS